MKKFTLSFTLLMLTIMFAFVTVGCNAPKKDENAETFTTSSSEVTAEEDTSTENSTVPSQNATDTDSSDEYYTQDENEMEIMTVPSQEDRVPATKPDAVPVETEPTLLPDGEVIELPFVPIQ